MVKLAIQYPTAHQSVFAPYCDFEVIDASLWKEGTYESPLEEVWFDQSKGGAPQKFIARRNAVIVQGHNDPDTNIIEIARANEWVKVGLFRGNLRHLSLLSTVCDIVACPNTLSPMARGMYVNSTNSRRFHYYGMSSLDELRLRPPASLHTSLPITAAMVGIDLRSRERRPKKVPEFRYDLKLSKQVVELAIQNILAVREAYEEGVQRCPTTT
jgi:hypothetical protein